MPTDLIDTHVHLYAEQFASDREEVIARAREAGVTGFLLPAVDVASIEAALELARRVPGCRAMAALHPSETKEATEADFARVAALCDEPGVVAVGESGLDYYWDRSFDERQHEFLRRHVRLAIEKDLPLVLHNREASEDLVRILEEERAASAHPERLRGVFHCFGGSADFARRVLDLGFHLGIGGTLTFKNAGVADAIAGAPMERIVLETDAPYLAPVPHRGRRNEPAYLRLVAERLAEAKGLPLAEVARITTENAVRLFGDPGQEG